MKADLNARLEDLLRDYDIIEVLVGLVELQNKAYLQAVDLREGAYGPGKDEQ